MSQFYASRQEANETVPQFVIRFLELAPAVNTLPHAGGAHGHIPYRNAGTTTHDTATDGFVWATNRGGHQKSLTIGQRPEYVHVITTGGRPDNGGDTLQAGHTMYHVPQSRTLRLGMHTTHTLLHLSLSGTHTKTLRVQSSQPQCRFSPKDRTTGDTNGEHYAATGTQRARATASP